MTDRRIIALRYNIGKRSLVDANNVELQSDNYPSVTYKEYPVIFIDFLNTDGTAYTGFTDMMVFSASIDNNFNHADTLMSKTYNAEINVAGDRDDLSVATGKLSIQVNANTTEFGTKLGTSPDIDAMFELKAHLAAYIDGTLQAFPVFVARFPIVCLNMLDIDNLPDPTEPADGSYYNTTEVDALLAGKVSKIGTSDIEITDDDKGLIQVDRVTGTAYRLVISNGTIELEAIP
jgi:hypothetical protein